MSNPAGNGGSNGRPTRQSSRPTRNITGPQSALTDFLAAHNISAAEIRSSFEQRRQAQVANGPTAPVTPDDEEVDEATVPATNSAAQSGASNGVRSSRRKSTQTAKSKGKRKRSEDSDDEDWALSNALNESSRPAPGQIDHCDICTKKFTVTPYSKTGPDGGLLCPPCSRSVDKGTGPVVQKPRAYQGVSRKRKVQSSIMDRTFRLGAKGLTTLAVETLAKNVDLADDLGELPDHLIDKVARLLSKRRLVNSSTVQLFVKPHTEELKIYDGAKLCGDDLRQCFGICQSLRSFKLRNAIMFKDDVMAYLLSRNLELEHISLHGANLLTDAAWMEYLRTKGKSLRSLKLHFTDLFFGDDMIEALVAHCPKLQRLSLRNNQKLTEKGIQALQKLQSLEYLSLKLTNEISDGAYHDLFAQIGPSLKTISLREVAAASDTVLQAIHKHCRKLTKLRITESYAMTDEGFASLFGGWENPPLEYVDFAKCRHMDASDPKGLGLDGKAYGLGPAGFLALMAHSGPALRHLNVESARFITTAAFEEAFAEDRQYPELRHVEVAFCENVTELVVGYIFRCCPNLKSLVVFGCMNVTGKTVVPQGKLLIGVPNVMGMTIKG